MDLQVHDLHSHVPRYGTLLFRRENGISSMLKPIIRKRFTWNDSQITMAERLTAFEALPPNEKAILKKAGYRPGTIPTNRPLDAIIGAAREASLSEVSTASATALRRRDVASVNSIIGAIKNTDMLGIDHKLPDVAIGVIRLILQELELKAYRTFRDRPSSENYTLCYAARRRLDDLGIPWGDKYPVDVWGECRIKPPLQSGPYVVQRGDWLSKIAKRFYGRENLWDAIYEFNDYNGHPDRIFPGTRLKIFGIR